MDCKSEESLTVEKSEGSGSTQRALAKEEPWDTYLMTDLPGRKTGLPMVIYVSLRQGRQDPRIMVSKQYGDKWVEGKNFFLTLENEPRMIGESGEIQEEDVKLVQKWIELNHGKILALWNDEIDVFQANFTRVRYNIVLKGSHY